MGSRSSRSALAMWLLFKASTQRESSCIWQPLKFVAGLAIAAGKHPLFTVWDRLYALKAILREPGKPNRMQSLFSKKLATAYRWHKLSCARLLYCSTKTRKEKRPRPCMRHQSCSHKQMPFETWRGLTSSLHGLQSWKEKL